MNCIRKILTDRIKQRRFFLCSLLLLVSFIAHSQILVYPVQNFNFGTFYQRNSGGTIEISTDGSRSATGDIILMNTGASESQAIFEIEAPANSLISMIYSNSILSNGNGGIITMEITGSNPASFFTHTAVSPERSTVHFSGKLTVGNISTSPPGAYQGTVSVTFNYE